MHCCESQVLAAMNGISLLGGELVSVTPVASQSLKHAPPLAFLCCLWLVPLHHCSHDVIESMHRVVSLEAVSISFAAGWR